MKRFLLTTLIAISIAASGYAAGTKTVSTLAKHSFQHEYAGVSNVTWTVVDDLAKASFENAGDKMEVFYSATGEKVATATQIKIEDLPIASKRIFAKQYGDYNVSEAIRYETDEEVSYYISAQKNNESVILKATETQLSVYNRVRK